MFDAHVHIIDPRFPLTEDDGDSPAPFTVADYRAEVADLDIDGGVVVSGAIHDNDHGYLKAILPELGTDWVGVTQLDPEATEDEIIELDRIGVRAIRFNLARAAIDIEGLTLQALRAHELVGWHVELFADGPMLASLQPVLAKLPALSIDHLGMSEEAMPYVLALVDRGVRVKASGFRRTGLDLVSAMRRIHAVNPAALMFGTDLPGPDRRFDRADLELIAEAVGPDGWTAVVTENARQFYRLPPIAHAADSGRFGAGPAGDSAEHRTDHPDAAGE
ncbi:amidohydrolase family protein [Skermania piniformis]|uniref:Amidohydrolase family protein n=1 Tax=Skermania pinensis TaxID=39122 RepID=A0ABX8SB61_9ACTN|nr:amidohydrolase family protein [Skermania piniformis]QXQ14239.1 amidohydrolase family protein [Skermania piniformis]